MKSALLVNVDAKWNLAIRRMRTYYERQGWQVDMLDLGYGFYRHKKSCTINGMGYDVVAVSNIFEENAHRVDVSWCDNVTYGGIGSRNPDAKLPPEIEACPPWYGPYEDTAHGYITRGCIRNCYFCKVPAHEGLLRPYADVRDVVGNFRKAVFHDNNILAWDGATNALEWLRDNGIKCKFDQGLDMRLADEDNLALLASLNYMGEYVFAFDNIAYLPIMEKKMPLVKKYIPKAWRVKCFVYISKDMPIRDTVARVEWLRERECLPYIMRDQDCYGSEHEHFYTDLASWCNQPGLFKKMGFAEFLDKRHPSNPERGGGVARAVHGPGVAGVRGVLEQVRRASHGRCREWSMQRMPADRMTLPEVKSMQHNGSKAECEAYVIRTGYQCGNCGHVMAQEPEECGSCGAVVVGVVDEGEACEQCSETGMVRCRDCSKAHRIDEGLVCTRFGCFHHLTPPDGFCHDGVRRG